MSEVPEKRERAASPGEAAMRVSARERDEVARKLQAAFAQGMLDDSEFDTRVNAALAAKTRGELYVLTEDLPDLPTSETPPAAKPAGRFITTYGSRVERRGRWTVPERVSPVIFKGKAVIDLRAATLTAEETRFRVTAYKSTVEIIVPPGVGIDSRGFAYKGGWVDETGDDSASGGGGGEERRTVRVRGIAYKSTVIIRRVPRS